MPPKIVKVEIKGVDAFSRECRNMAREGKVSIAKIIKDAATTCHRLAVESITQHKGSREARRYRPKRDVTVSPEGSPPNSDKGTLVANIKMEKIEGGWTVGSREGAPHGFWLEFGTSKMGARPWLSPAFIKTMEFIRGKYG